MATQGLVSPIAVERLARPDLIHMKDGAPVLDEEFSTLVVPLMRVDWDKLRIEHCLDSSFNVTPNVDEIDCIAKEIELAFVGK